MSIHTCEHSTIGVGRAQEPGRPAHTRAAAGHPHRLRRRRAPVGGSPGGRCATTSMSRSRCDGPRPGPCACLRLLTVRAMLRDGLDPAGVAAVTGVPRALVDLVLTLDLDRH